MRQDAAFTKGLELVFEKLRRARSGFRFDLGEEGLELFLHHLIERRFLRAPPPQRLFHWVYLCLHYELG